ncbi:MAG TPA: hypothetical protein PKA42_03470 [Candidatus Paceibacterota bacterium]|nr:hypothetical protein [Candidatus Paceibacterota bacterium]HMO83202.1 hypothetical protein [Candidatus Paceibacterota bacterium]
MGSSSSSQKKTDRQPLPRLKGGSGEGGSITEGNVCPSVFRIKLNKNGLLKNGSQLQLNTKHEILHLGLVVGVVSKHYQDLITRCTNEGVTYAKITVVIERTQDRTTYYAEFRQR